MPSPLSPHTKDSTPLSFLPNLPPPSPHYHVYQCFLDFYCVLSPYDFTSFFSQSFSTSTRSDAGCGLPLRDGRGSPDVNNVPTPPPAQVEPTSHSSVNPTPILSVDVPLAAHHLREGTLDGHAHDILHSHLYAPHLHRAFKFHLEPNSPLWSITRMYLQNQCLKAILDLASSPSSIGRRCNTLRTIQHEVEEDLFSTFYQMQMPEFADDLE